MPGKPLAPFALVAAVALCGCDDLDEFRTDDGTVFHGQVIGAGNEADPSFIRQGFESATEMELTFDPALAAAEEPSAPVGTLLTYQCPPEEDFCREGDRVVGDFDRVELEPIRSLVHDALSEYDFPGAGRIRNFILGARFQSGEGDTLARRHAMVFVSLMENRNIELRVVAPSVLDADGDELHAALFGVFVLERKAAR